MSALKVHSRLLLLLLSSPAMLFTLMLLPLFVITAAAGPIDDGARDSNEEIFDLSHPHRPDEAAKDRLRLWVTISAQNRYVEVSWQNGPAQEGDYIMLTNQEPHTFERARMSLGNVGAGPPLAAFNASAALAGWQYERMTAYDPLWPEAPSASAERASRGETQAQDDRTAKQIKATVAITTTTPAPPPRPLEYWMANGGVAAIVAAIKPTTKLQWYTTGVPFDYALSRNVTVQTRCYAYWASYVNATGHILASACLSAHPTWMADLHSAVSDLRMRDLFLPGTHDSGSYRPNFDPLARETIVTKYALTQDDDIRGQLMHGARYLDIRVGYYRSTPEKFFINHGITRQRPLQEIIDQVKEFVLATNEIVIFGLKEFPVGFGRTLSVHQLLVHYLREQFDNLIVHPSLTWRASLREIWARKQNIILAYDKFSVVSEFPNVLFGSVEQRWGDVRKWPRLEEHLRIINSFDSSRLSSRPVADMAELTPDTWDVLLDKYGGLRRMADHVNWRVSHLYRDELGASANIVAVDFMRGTTLVDVALDWNKRKVIY